MQFTGKMTHRVVDRMAPSGFKLLIRETLPAQDGVGAFCCKLLLAWEILSRSRAAEVLGLVFSSAS